MPNNYTPSYNQYLTQTAGYALPSSVRTYSVFDPSSNSWRRMTNDGRSPMPAQGQTPVADALALARQTQGRDWSAQPAPMPAQAPLGGPRMASPASRGGAAVVPMGQGRNVAPRASQGQIPVLPGEGAVQAPSTLYQGMGKTQEDGTVYTPLAVAVGSRPSRQDIAITREGLSVPSVPFANPADTVAANRGLPPTEQPVERPVTVRDAIDAEYNNIPLRLQQMTGLIGGGLNVGPALASFRSGDAAVAAAKQAYQKGMMRSQLRRPVAPKQTSTPFSDAPEIEAANRFSPLRSDWVSPKKNVRMNPFVTTPTGTVYRYKPAIGYDTPALPAPKVEVPTGRMHYIRTPEVITPYGGFRALPNGAGNLHMGTIETGGIRPNIATPLQMTTPSGLARWQYRLDQLSGLGR